MSTKPFDPIEAGKQDSREVWAEARKVFDPIKNILAPDDHTLHEPEAIYLEPKCQGEKWGRAWYENTAWGECDCGLSHPSVKYIRADLAAPKPIPADDREEVAKMLCALAIPRSSLLTNAQNEAERTRMVGFHWEKYLPKADAAISTLQGLGWTKARDNIGNCFECGAPLSIWCRQCNPPPVHESKDAGITNSCGCVFCDLDLKPLEINGSYWHDVNGGKLIKCSIAPTPSEGGGK